MPLCKELTKSGKQCKSHCLKSFDFCRSHSPDCSICYDKLVSKQVQELHCGHLFHHECVERWIEESHTCPICRTLTDHRLIFDENIKPSNLTQEFMAELVFGMMNLPLPPISVRVIMSDEGRPIFVRD